MHYTQETLTAACMVVFCVTEGSQDKALRKIKPFLPSGLRGVRRYRPFLAAPTSLVNAAIERLHTIDHGAEMEASSDQGAEAKALRVAREILSRAETKLANEGVFGTVVFGEHCEATEAALVDIATPWVAMLADESRIIRMQRFAQDVMMRPDFTRTMTISAIARMGLYFPGTGNKPTMKATEQAAIQEIIDHVDAISRVGRTTKEVTS